MLVHEANLHEAKLHVSSSASYSIYASNEPLNYFKLILTESVREKFKAFKQGISALKYFKLFHKMCIGSQ